MTRKRFIKMLMAAGVPRNRANTILAYEARLLGRSYFKYLGDFLTQLDVCAWRITEELRAPLAATLCWRKSLVGTFRPYPVLRITHNPYIEPLRRQHHDGLRFDFVAVDEMSHWPKENPHFGIGGTARYEEPTKPGGPTLITHIDIREVSLIPDNMYPLGGGGHD